MNESINVDWAVEDGRRPTRPVQQAHIIESNEQEQAKLDFELKWWNDEINEW